MVVQADNLMVTIDCPPQILVVSDNRKGLISNAGGGYRYHQRSCFFWKSILIGLVGNRKQTIFFSGLSSRPATDNNDTAAQFDGKSHLTDLPTMFTSSLPYLPHNHDIDNVKIFYCQKVKARPIVCHTVEDCPKTKYIAGKNYWLAIFSSKL